LLIKILTYHYKWFLYLIMIEYMLLMCSILQLYMRLACTALKRRLYWNLLIHILLLIFIPQYNAIILKFFYILFFMQVILLCYHEDFNQGLFLLEDCIHRSSLFFTYYYLIWIYYIIFQCFAYEGQVFTLIKKEKKYFF